MTREPRRTSPDQSAPAEPAALLATHRRIAAEIDAGTNVPAAARQRSIVPWLSGGFTVLALLWLLFARSTERRVAAVARVADSVSQRAISARQDDDAALAAVARDSSRAVAESVTSLGMLASRDSFTLYDDVDWVDDSGYAR